MYLASLIPLGVVPLAVLGYRLSGGVPVGSAPLTFTVVFNLLVINLLSGAVGEEPGWRGFALPRRLERYSPLKAGLVLGLMWSFWHLGLWLLASGYSGTTLLVYILAFTITLMALNLLMVWIYQTCPVQPGADGRRPLRLQHRCPDRLSRCALVLAQGYRSLAGWLALSHSSP